MISKNEKSRYWSKHWLAFINGDMDAFHCIYVAFFDKLYAYGSKIIGDNTILEDSIQELFLQLYSKRKNLSKPENLEFYLLKSLKLIIYQKQRKGSKIVLSNFENDNGESHNFIFKEEMYSDVDDGGREEDKKLKIMLSSLDEKQRELLYLKFYNNLSYKEIGALVGVHPDSAKKQVYRIVSRLKSKFKKDMLNFLSVFYSMCDS